MLLININQGVKESKAIVLSTLIFRSVGSNPTLVIFSYLPISLGNFKIYIPITPKKYNKTFEIFREKN